jgi:prepilin-type N-terminal cleavage/methylation domain-containing protein
MKARRSEDGFTLIETLVTLGLISIVTTTFYSVMFSGARGSETTRNVTRVTEEARSGLNRMVRDTREADLLLDVSANSYNVRIDFNGDGVFENPNVDGDFEDLIYSYHAASKTIRLTAPPLNSETLVAGVERLGAAPIFSFTSSLLKYDWDANGVTTLAELAAAPKPPHNDTSVTAGNEAALLSAVGFEFQVHSGDSMAEFFAEAHLRNRR